MDTNPQPTSKFTKRSEVTIPRGSYFDPKVNPSTSDTQRSLWGGEPEQKDEFEKTWDSLGEAINGTSPTGKGSSANNSEQNVTALAESLRETFCKMNKQYNIAWLLQGYPDQRHRMSGPFDTAYTAFTDAWKRFTDPTEIVSVPGAFETQGERRLQAAQDAIVSLDELKTVYEGTRRVVDFFRAQILADQRVGEMTFVDGWPSGIDKPTEDWRFKPQEEAK